MTTLPRCTSWLGHKFRPRYSYSSADLTAFQTITMRDWRGLEQFRDKTYEGDICVRCGLRIDRRRG